MVLRDLHVITANVVIVVNGLIGVWGLALAVAKRAPKRAFNVAKYVGLGVAGLQVAFGLMLYGRGVNPGSIHMFYGMIIIFTLAFVYIYRAQFEKRPAFAWGWLALFVMGLGIRGWMNFGENFRG